MDRPLELHSHRRKQPDLREYIVTIHDERGALVCWCGPYDLRAWRDCVHLFVDAGWTEADRHHHYTRLGRAA